MIKFITSIIFSLMGIALNAHQTDIASTSLIQKNDSTWVVQVRAPLISFKHEVEKEYGTNSYKSSEEFISQLKEVYRKNTKISFNGIEKNLNEHLIVKLGHETILTTRFTQSNENIELIDIQNSIFKHVNRSKNHLVILPLNKKVDRLLLNSENNYKIRLKKKANTYIINDSIDKNTIIIIICILLLSPLLYFIWKK